MAAPSQGQELLSLLLGRSSSAANAGGGGIASLGPREQPASLSVASTQAGTSVDSPTTANSLDDLFKLLSHQSPHEGLPPSPVQHESKVTTDADRQAALMAA